MIGPSPNPQPQPNQQSESPLPTPAPSPKRPPLSKPSPAPPKRKRRRPPPPLSVTSVFTQHRLPTSASELWEWPVTSWYAGQVGPHDVKLATEQPFLDHQALATQHEAKTPPNHYRLRWLEHDARRIVHPDRPQTHPLVDPFDTLPYAGKKDTGACERPMPGVKRLLEDLDDHKSPSLSRRNAKRSRRSHRRNSKHDDLRTVADDDTPNRQNQPHSRSAEIAAIRSGAEMLPTDARNDHTASQENPSLHQNALGTAKDCPTKTQPAHHHQSLAWDVKPSLKVLSDQQPVIPNGDHGPQKLSKNEMLDQIEPTDPCTSTGLEADTSFGSSKSSDAAKKRLVTLQFQSPHESRLMGSLTYSVPVPAVYDGVDKKPKGNDDNAESSNFQVSAKVHPHSLDLQFRKTSQDFVAVFEDRDVADELRPEIRKRSNMLLPLDEKAKPLREAMLDAIQNEMKKQEEFADLVAEGDRLVAKLKEIQQKKKAAKYAARQAINGVGSANRRSSDRKRVTSPTDYEPSTEESGRRSRSRSRRPSRLRRKIVDLTEVDDDDPDEQGEIEPVIPDYAPSLGGRDAGVQPLHKSDQTDISATGVVAPIAQKASESAETVATVTEAPTHVMKSVPLAESEACAEGGPSTASSPSDDGTETCIMKSPCGLFPGESEDASHLACIASPVSPLGAPSSGAKNGSYPQLKIALKLRTSPK